MRYLICLDPNQDLESYGWLCLCCLTYCYKAFGMIMVSNWCSIETRRNESLLHIYRHWYAYLIHVCCPQSGQHGCVCVLFADTTGHEWPLFKNPSSSVSQFQCEADSKYESFPSQAACEILLKRFDVEEPAIDWRLNAEARDIFWQFTGSVIGKADSDQVVSSCCSVFALLRRACGRRLCMNWWQSKTLRSSLQ